MNNRLLLITLAAATLLPLLLTQLQMAQQLAYFSSRYTSWAKRTVKTYPYPLLLLAAVATLWRGADYLVALLLVSVALLAWRTHLRAKIQPLVFTWRVRRLLLAASLLLALPMVLFNNLAVNAVLTGALLLQPVCALALLIMAPLERLLARRHVNAARRRLLEINPLVVGITGSYGKTTTKVMLAGLLADQVAALATPQSFNTLLGITRTINELLRPFHRVFLAEMGARRPGDIAALTRLATPQIGIITAVGPMHIEHFGSLAAVQSTKFELAAALPMDGLLIVCLEALRNFAGPVACRFVTVAVNDPAADVHACDITYSAAGSAFTLVHPAGEIFVRIPHLGRAALHDFLCAAAGALELGVTLDRLAAAAKNLQAAPHRLQPSSVGQLTLIDDTYSANLAGVAAALEVLTTFPAPRVLVTPGIVELGAGSHAANQRFGEMAAVVCDELVLVESLYSEAIIEGWTKIRGEGALAVRAGSREAAFKYAYALAAPGGTVLACSDLPDVCR